jgi:aminopeptidase N
MRPVPSVRSILAGCLVVLAVLPSVLSAQASGPPYTRADTLRGSNTPERAWWDVTFYDLDVRVRPEDRAIDGSVGIVYRVVDTPRDMQIDLQQPLVVDSVVQQGRTLDVRREDALFYVTPVAPGTSGELDTITVHYHGQPTVAVNPPWDGGFTWAADSLGNRWIATSDQGLGASVWWPDKDTQRDEPEAQRIAITVPDDLIDVSNGRLRSVVHHDNGTTTYEWYVSSPINNYGVAVNAGAYTHEAGIFHGEDGVLTLDFWPLAYHADAARRQFTQVSSMLACYERWFGPYPWYEDGYKLVETPHLGMEHQSGIAYGNLYMNGYLGGDLSGTGLGLRWDYIIVHESAHEWFGNNITTADMADMWVHESFANYAEGLYVECQDGKDAGAEYIRGLRRGIENDAPIIPAYGVNAEGSGDMYPKGANMLHTIRQVVDDDELWRATLRGVNREFRHSIVTGDQIRSYFSDELGVDLDGVFRQYLTTAELPVLELQSRGGVVSYRWTDVVEGFRMPIDVQVESGACSRIEPTGEWETLAGASTSSDVAVDQDYYVMVRREGGGTRPPAGDCG